MNREIGGSRTTYSSHIDGHEESQKDTVVGIMKYESRNTSTEMPEDFDSQVVSCLQELERYSRVLASRIPQALDMHVGIWSGEDLINEAYCQIAEHRDNVIAASNARAYIIGVLKNVQLSILKTGKNRSRIAEGFFGGDDA